MCNPEFRRIPWDETILRQEKIEHMRDHFGSILEYLYSSEPLELHQLEFSLDEICHALGMKLNENDLQIQRKPSKESVSEFSRQVAKSYNCEAI